MNHARSGVVWRLRRECTSSAHSDWALSTQGHLLLYLAPWNITCCTYSCVVFVTIQFTTYLCNPAYYVGVPQDLAPPQLLPSPRIY